jgi:hypothetical protein
MEANQITLKTLAISIAAVVALEIVFRLALNVQTGSPLPALGLIRCLEALSLIFIVGRFEKNPNAIGLSRSKMLPGLVRGLIWSVCFGIAAGILFLVLFAAGIDPLKFVNTLSMILITFLSNGYAKGIPITSFFPRLSGTVN